MFIGGFFCALIFLHGKFAFNHGLCYVCCMGKKQHIGNVAKAQALRFHFNLKYARIAVLLKVSRRTVQAHCACVGGVKEWQSRTNKEEIVNAVFDEFFNTHFGVIIEGTR